MQDIIAILGMDDYLKKQNVLELKSTKGLSQPFTIAEQFMGMKGVFVNIEDTIKGFTMIMDEVDKYPEAAFNLKNYWRGHWSWEKMLSK